MVGRARVLSTASASSGLKQEMTKMLQRQSKVDISLVEAWRAYAVIDTRSCSSYSIQMRWRS